MQITELPPPPPPQIIDLPPPPPPPPPPPDETADTPRIILPTGGGILSPGPLIQIPARKPVRISHLEEHLVVPYPRDIAQPDDPLRRLCYLGAVLDPTLRLVDSAKTLIKQQLMVDCDPILAARVSLLALAIQDDMKKVLPLFAPLRPAGLAALAALQQAHPGVPPGGLLPLPLGKEAGPIVPLRYVPLHFNRLRLSSPTELDQVLWRMMPHLTALLGGLAQLAQDGLGPAVPPLLAHQVFELCDEADFQLCLLCSDLRHQAIIGYEEMKKDEVRLRLLDEERERQETNMVVMGEDDIPSRLVKIGKLEDGRLLSMTLSSPQFIVLLGAQGFGKSHLATLLAEGAALYLEGLNRLGKGPSHVWIFCNEWRNKKGNRQFLKGLYPNPDPDELATLRDHFHYAGNAAHERLVLMCLPGQKEHYLKTLPDLIERGLEVHEARLHPSELVQTSYAMLFNDGSEHAGADKPKWMQYVEQVLAEQPGIHPRELARLLTDKRIGTATMFKQLKVLEHFVSEDEHITDHLRDLAPRVVLLESQTMPRDLVLPVQVMMMNALSADEMDEHLMIVLEEGNKGLENRAIQESIVTGAAEVRHGGKTIVISAQQGANFPQRLWPLVTAGVLFYVPSPAEYRRMQEQIGALAEVPYEVVAKLGVAEVLAWAVRVSDGKLRGRAFKARTRPACVMAGGKTRHFA